MNRSVVWLRVEALATLILSVALYSEYGAGWTTFALLLLLPDISILGYLGGPRIGAAIYNSVHSYAAPLLLTTAATAFSYSSAIAVILVWFAHIALDRALGYGLKLPTGFHDTHLGRIGRQVPAQATVPAA